VEYSLVQKEGQWGIQDVTIDGVSIVGNDQNQFHKVILAPSFDALLKKTRLQALRQALAPHPHLASTTLRIHAIVMGTR
jgi:MlaC protein